LGGWGEKDGCVNEGFVRCNGVINEVLTSITRDRKTLDSVEIVGSSTWESTLNGAFDPYISANKKGNRREQIPNDDKWNCQS